MNKIEEYITLSEKADELVDGGMNALNPIVRSICRKLWKLYWSATREEQLAIDGYNNIPFK